MLILPLHRPLTLATAPLATLLLIVINVAVFFGWQSSDGVHAREAFEYYAQSGLAEVEWPLYRDWRAAHGQAPLDDADAAGIIPSMQSDEAFRAALADGRLWPADMDPEAAAQWHERRERFDALWARIFTLRHEMRFSHVEPWRMVTAMFLHGSVGHLVGNMLFLLMLGLLVEGALGALLFVALYLVGGDAAQWASLAFRWGQEGAALGASGAIAALMGAYCVLWGTRKVRVFYWVFVVFDYVRVPALALLPLWVGWELFNLAFHRDAHVGLDAHASGMLAGALVAWGVRRLGWERRDFLDEEERGEQRDQAGRDFDTAMEHLGRLEIDAARTLLRKVDLAEPGQLRVACALYRCARYARRDGDIAAAARRVFACDAADAADVALQKGVFDEVIATQPALASVAERARMAPRWLRVGAVAETEALLRDAGTADDASTLAPLWLDIARRTPALPARARLLRLVEKRYPGSEAAAKARVLIEDLKP